MIVVFLQLQIWDTAGAERYRGSVMSQYYRNVSAIIIVFDVTRRSTFDNVTFWLSECDKHTQENNLPRVLVGNKCDRESNREVFNQEAQNFADKHHIPFFAVSRPIYRPRSECLKNLAHCEQLSISLRHKMKQQKDKSIPRCFVQGRSNSFE